MNQQQRDELREKHRPEQMHSRVVCAYCWQDTTLREADRVQYPCDVIQVLDAWEATTDPLSQPERTNGPVSPAQTECHHIRGVETAAGSIVKFAYCPKCGEKL